MNTAGEQEQTYGTDWYASGGFPAGTFCNPQPMSPENAAKIRQSLLDSLKKHEET